MDSTREEEHLHKTLSIHLSRGLDGMGYSARQIQFRRDVYSERCNILNADSKGKRIYIVGSKGEGVTNVYESDMDVLMVVPGICFEKGLTECHGIRKDAMVFSMVTENCYPGYSLLQYVRGKETNRETFKSCFPFPDGYYISHEHFMKIVETVASSDTDFPPRARQGPSIPVVNGNMEMDRVVAFQCICPSILNEWCNRPRRYEWPSLELRREVVNMDAFLVAIGHAGSVNKDFEWRICFNSGELKLMHSLNETQTKLYIILKMILKEIIQPKDKEITSYVMKNIVLWMAELYPMQLFKEENFLQLIMKALRILKVSTKMRYCPYYMIPGRNLLVGKMKPLLQLRVLVRIREMLRAGPWFLLWLRKINIALIRLNPRELEWFKNWRDEIEMLHLLLWNLKHLYNTYITDELELQIFCEHDVLYNQMSLRLFGLVMPGCMLLVLQGVDVNAMAALVNARLGDILR